jgi:hypothetical protein
MNQRTLRQVLENAGTLTTTSTTTGSNIITDFAGKAWNERTIHFGEALRRFDQSCIEDTRMVGNGLQAVSFIKNTSHKQVTLSKSEGATARTETALDNLDAVTLSIGQSDFKQGDVTVSKESEMTSMTNLGAEARYAVANDLAQRLDVAIATAYQATAIDNRVFPDPTYTSPSSIGNADKFHVDMIADAMEKIEANNFVPHLLFVNTKAIRELRKSSQFVDASTFGSDVVVKKGQIGSYLGIDIIKTTNCPAFSSGATDVNQNDQTWGANGAIGIMTGTNHEGVQAAGAIAWKEKPTIAYEFEKKTNVHHFYTDQCFKVGVIHPKAVCLLKYSNV